MGDKKSLLLGAALCCWPSTEEPKRLGLVLWEGPVDNHDDNHHNFILDLRCAIRYLGLPDLLIAQLSMLFLC